MRFGSVPGVGGHPLFLPVFVLTTAVNYMAAIHHRPGYLDHVLLAMIHAAFGGWLLSAHGAMKRQREIELTRMRHLRDH